MIETSTHKIPITRPDLGEEEASAARRAILSGWITRGPEVEQFEDEFSAYVGADHACSWPTVRPRVHLALHALGGAPVMKSSR